MPGVEVLIEKLSSKIIGRLGKENHSKIRYKVAFVQRKCALTSSVLVRFLYAKSSEKMLCMQRSCECCSACVHKQEVFV